MFHWLWHPLMFNADEAMQSQHPPSPLHKGEKKTQNSKLQKNMTKKEIIQKIIHLLATILTAIATTLGTTSCIGLMQ